jgi:hypothetical protein
VELRYQQNKFIHTLLKSVNSPYPTQTYQAISLEEYMRATILALKERIADIGNIGKKKGF